MKLLDVVREVALATIELLLEIHELRAPPLDPILAEDDVGLELGLAMQ